MQSSVQAVDDVWVHGVKDGFDVDDPLLRERFDPAMLVRVQEWIDAGLHRGRTEWHDDHLLVLFRVPVMDRQEDRIWIRGVVVLATRDSVLSLDDTPAGHPPVTTSLTFDRFRSGGDRNSGRLVAIIMDEIASWFIRVVEELDQEATELEDLFEDANPHSRNGSSFLRDRLKQFRSDLHDTRRALQPTMEAVRQILSGIDLEGEELFPGPVERRLRDNLDKLLYASEALDGVREEVLSLRDYLQARIANEQNEVMKTLTIVAALVLVPTFVVGFFGQNFVGMPGLHDGFWFAVALMVGVVVVELVFLWWRGWIGNRGDSRVERAWRAAVGVARRPWDPESTGGVADDPGTPEAGS